jgi:putative SOS response-associated peptidase YedK
LIPADGFFEWKRTGREKRPFYFQVNDESPFAFAGIWDTWSSRGDVVTSCAIITTAANELVRELHDRMPTIVFQEFHDDWLDLNTDPAVLKKLLTPFPASKMKSYPVSRAVNAPENEGEKLIAHVDAEVGTIPSLF